jgi:hypothetical protein
VQRVCVALLRDLAGNTALRVAIVTAGGVDAILASMERFPKSAALQEVSVLRA